MMDTSLAEGDDSSIDRSSLSTFTTLELKNAEAEGAAQELEPPPVSKPKPQVKAFEYKIPRRKSVRGNLIITIEIFIFDLPF